MRSLTFFSSLSALYRYKKFLIISYLAVGLTSLVISLIIPKVYKSTATIMINPSEQILSIPGSLQDLIPPSLLGGSSNTDVDQFLAILNSSSMADSIIAKFDLFRVYDREYRKQVLNELYRNVGFTDNDDGTVTIHARYKQRPEKSTEMVSYIIDTLNKININLSQERIRNSRIFLEKEYQEIKDALKESEYQFATIQRKYGIIEFPEQVKASITMIGELETQRLVNKIQHDYLSKTYGKDHPIVKNIREQMDSYKEEISRLTGEFDQSIVILPLQKVPDLGVEYFEAMRDFTINEALFEFITPVYEKAKLDEMKNVPNFVVLDYPVVPDYKDSPKRLLIIIISVLLYSITSTFIILLREYFRINREAFQKVFSDKKEQG